MLAEGLAPKPLSTPSNNNRSESSASAPAAVALGGRWRKRERSDIATTERAKMQRLKGSHNSSSSFHGGRDHRYYPCAEPSETSSLVGRDGGLCSLASVDRLINIMQHEKVQKTVEHTTNRTMLARVVSATTDHDLLAKFLNLGGLGFLDSWLHEALKAHLLSDDSNHEDDDTEDDGFGYGYGDGGDGDAEKRRLDLFSAIVAALERLPVDLVVLKSCPIAKTVKSLRNHRDLDVQRRAKRLVDLWKRRVDAEMKQQAMSCDSPTARGASLLNEGHHRREAADQKMSAEKSSTSDGHGLRQIMKAETMSNCTGLQNSAWSRADTRKGDKSSTLAMAEQTKQQSNGGHRHDADQTKQQGYGGVHRHDAADQMKQQNYGGGHRQDAEKAPKSGNNSTATPSAKFASVATLCSSPESSRTTMGKTSPSLQIDGEAQAKAMATVLLRPRSRSSPHNNSKCPLNSSNISKMQTSASPSPRTTPLSSPDATISRRPLRSRRQASTPQWTTAENRALASNEISDGISLLANIAASESSMNDTTREAAKPPSCTVSVVVSRGQGEEDDGSVKVRSRKKDRASECVQIQGGAAISEVTVERDRVSSSVSSPSEADSQLDAMAGESWHSRSADMAAEKFGVSGGGANRRHRLCRKRMKASSVEDGCGVLAQTSPEQEEEKRVETAGDSSITEVVDHGSSAAGLMASTKQEEDEGEDRKQKDSECSRISSPAAVAIAATVKASASSEEEDGSDGGDAGRQVPVQVSAIAVCEKKLGLAFDLNEMMSSCEEDDATHICKSSKSAANNTGLLAVPIAVMAATKGPFAVPVPASRPIAELGWKGSAATSAFRPTAIHRHRRTDDASAAAAAASVSEQSMHSPSHNLKAAIAASTAEQFPAHNLKPAIAAAATTEQSMQSPANNVNSAVIVLPSTDRLPAKNPYSAIAATTTIDPSPANHLKSAIAADTTSTTTSSTEQSIPSPADHLKSAIAPHNATTTERATPSPANDQSSITTNADQVMSQKKKSLPEFDLNAEPDVGLKQDEGNEAGYGSSPRRRKRSSHVWDLNQADETGTRAMVSEQWSERAKVSFDLNDGPMVEDHEVDAGTDLQRRFNSGDGDEAGVLKRRSMECSVAAGSVAVSAPTVPPATMAPPPSPSHMVMPPLFAPPYVMESATTHHHSWPPPPPPILPHRQEGILPYTMFLHSPNGTTTMQAPYPYNLQQSAAAPSPATYGASHYSLLQPSMQGQATSAIPSASSSSLAYGAGIPCVVSSSAAYAAGLPSAVSAGKALATTVRNSQATMGGGSGWSYLEATRAPLQSETAMQQQQNWGRQSFDLNAAGMQDLSYGYGGGHGQQQHVMRNEKRGSISARQRQL